MITTHCPRCGAMMQQRYVEGRNREVCTACSYIFYRNPVPAVGTVVAFDGRVVLVRRKFDPQAGCWCLPAGYIELSESSEDAAVRECAEETGLQVKIETLLGVYSFGSGVYSGLIVIYAATAVGGRLQAGDDAAEAGVFALDNLPSPLAFHTHLQALEDWQKQTYHARLAAEQSTQARLYSADGLVVRVAHPTDAQALLRLLPLLSPGHQGHGSDQALMTMARLHNRLRDTTQPILVAEVDGAVAGFASVSFCQALTGWRAVIDDLAVDSAYRRRGLGHALVEGAVCLAQSYNCHSLHLNIDVEASPAAARSFSLACGFHPGNVATLRFR